MRNCGLYYEKPPLGRLPVPVGSFISGGAVFNGRVTVYECPEGLARKLGPIIREADMAIMFGTADGGPTDEQDARMMQATMAVAELRREE